MRARRVIRHAAGVVVLVAGGALLAPAASGAKTTVLALTGGTVHTVTGPTIGNATILVEDGKITQVGADVTAPPDAQVVSCAGKHIYPGMIAANTVLGLTEIGSVRGTNDFEETGNVNPDVRAEVQIN